MSVGINCPKCDKTLGKRECKEGRCNHCGLEFTIGPKSNLALYQEDALLETLANEVVRDRRKMQKKIQYYERAIELTKGYFRDVVCFTRHTSSTERQWNTTFFLVRDAEIVAFLFRLVYRVRGIYADFDMDLKGLKWVKKYKRNEQGTEMFRRVRCYLSTTDFQYAIELFAYVYERKSKRFGTGKYRTKMEKQTCAGLQGLRSGG